MHKKIRKKEEGREKNILIFSIFSNVFSLFCSFYRDSSKFDKGISEISYFLTFLA
jgi:hypothetical protein